MAFVDLPLPRHAFEVTLPIDVWGRCQAEFAVRSTDLPNTEVLDVDAALRQPEVWRIGAAVVLRKWTLVNRLIFVCDTVEVEPVRDFQLFEASDALTL